MEFTTSITVGGEIVTLAEEGKIKGTAAWMKANSIFCPLGAAHSEAWLLLTGKAIRALSTSAAHDIVWKVKSRQQSQTATNTFKDFKLVQAEKLFLGGEEEDNSLYLCQFADARYFANENSDSGTILANIRSQAQYNDYYTETAGETWTTLLTDLWNGCATLGAFPGLPPGLPIDAVPESTFLVGLNAYRALNAVLNQLDCAIAHNPFLGTYSIVQLGAAQAIPENRNRLAWNSEPISGTADIAAYVRIYFAKHHKNYGQENDTGIDDNWVFSGANNSLLVATGVAGASGTKPLWDDMPWILGEDGTNINTAGLSTRATNRKSRYVTRYNIDLVHKIYTSILDTYLPGGQIKAVLWRNYGDVNNAFGMTNTEIIAGPDFISYSRGNGDGKGLYAAKELSPPEYEAYTSQDISRRTFPNYPRLPNIVQVCHCDGGVRGQTVSANVNGLHRANVKRIVNGTMETLESCWLLFVDDYDNLLGQVNATQGQYYGPARLTGIITSVGETLPLYLVRNYESGVNLAGSNATTTTTTTTTPAVCSGRCKWIWNLADEIWELDSSNCGTATTTTTSTTTTAGSTTTTVALDCECVSGTTTTTNTSTSTTTTTTTASPCSCSYPAYCGTDDGECTYTNCVAGYVTTTLECTTTTSCDCNTTTTTPDCSGCSNYICTPTGWVLVDDNCTGLCAAEVPTSDCNFGSSGSCSGLGGISAGYGCSGECIYIYYDALNDWYFAYGNCSSTVDSSCYCQKPSYTGLNCARATTYCQSSHEIDPCQRCYSTTSTTTTTPPTGCTGDCKFDWDASIEKWILISSTCTAGCTCLTPSIAGVDECEVIWTKCAPSFTTTTTTTTTAAVCCPTAEGNCFYSFNFTTRLWSLTIDNCTALGCTCPAASEQCLPCTDSFIGGVIGESTTCGKWNLGAILAGDVPSYGGGCSAYTCADSNCLDYYVDANGAWVTFGPGNKPPGTLDSYYYKKCGGGDCFGGPLGAYCVPSGTCYDYLNPTDAAAIGGGTYYVFKTCAELITAGLSCTTIGPGCCCDPVTHICYASGTYDQSACEGLGNTFHPGLDCADITCQEQND